MLANKIPLFSFILKLYNRYRQLFLLSTTVIILSTAKRHILNTKHSNTIFNKSKRVNKWNNIYVSLCL